MKKWKNLQDYIQHNPMYNLYYKWYLRDFLNNNARMSEEEIQLLGELNQNVSIKSQDLIKDLRLDKVVFYKDSGIIHLSMQKEKIGTVVKANSGILKLLGMHSVELIGKNVAKIMP